MMSLCPVRILKRDTEEEKCEMARMSNFIGAITVGELIKSTLGPKGMDKILVSCGNNLGRIEISNDGATILKGIGFDNPAAKILVNMAKVQDDIVGDGTTSVAVLAAELLREADVLVGKKIHPQTVIAGYRLATEASLKALEIAALDNSSNEEQFKQDLFNLARTALSSKILNLFQEKFSKLVVDAVLRLKGSGNLNAIQVIKKTGGSLDDSFLDEGFILNKKVGQFQPKRIEKAKILIANTPMDTDKVKVFGSRVCVDSLAKVAELEVAEKDKMKDKVDKILKHNCNVFINRQLIYNYPEQLFADAGVMGIEHADFIGTERLALLTGAEIVSTFDSPEEVKLGECELIEEIMIGEEKFLKFSGVKLGEACSIVVRGATQQIVEEAERSLHDALAVLITTIKDKRIVYGGGCSEMVMARAVGELAATVSGKESVAMEAFSKALLELPTAISDNGGFDSSFLVTKLRAAHGRGDTTAGLDVHNGQVDCMKQLGVVDSYAVKRQMIISASEATQVILRVDHNIKVAPRKRNEDRRPC